MRNIKRITFISIFVLSLDQSLIQLSRNSEAFIFQFFVVYIL